jgi:hypothetical protein
VVETELFFDDILIVVSLHPPVRAQARPLKKSLCMITGHPSKFRHLPLLLDFGDLHSKIVICVPQNLVLF